MFLVNDKQVWRDKKLHDPWNYMPVMHVHFMFFAVFNNLKSSFSEDYMTEHALDIFIETPQKWLRLSH